MSSFHQLAYHVVFSTKYRRQILLKPNAESIYQYVGGIIRSLDCHLVEAGGIEDHVHLLLNIAPTIAVSDVIRTIKANSSKWINQQDFTQREFQWQKGYAAFTVSYSQRDAVRSYIQNQEEHHKTLSFEEEYIKILTRHGIPFERKYLFEQEHLG
ncbi:MAG: IS200/IS605 family transposase [Pirellulaceae bacterium]